MIESIKFKNHPIFNNKTLKFKELTLIVGENGSGKTTLIDCIMNYKEKENVERLNYTSATDFYWFDSNKHNPIHQNIGSEFGTKETVISHFMSHGESILPRILAVGKEKDTLFFIDEPESGISIKNQYKIVNAINKSLKNNNQLIIATHSYIIIKSFKEVLNLDIMDWQSSEDYLKTQETSKENLTISDVRGSLIVDEKNDKHPFAMWDNGAPCYICPNNGCWYGVWRPKQPLIKINTKNLNKDEH